jgi:hypothetical protein
MQLDVQATVIQETLSILIPPAQRSDDGHSAYLDRA